MPPSPRRVQLCSSCDCAVKLSIHRYFISFHFPQDWFFPIHSSPKMRHVIHGGSKVCFETSFKVVEFYLPYPPLPLRGRFRVSFLPSTRGLNVGRSFDVPLPSNRGPKLESAHEVFDFQFVCIPALPFRYANFHRFLKLTIAFSFLCSKNSLLEEM
ncbi:hypothetical protein AVEN_246459-1 [Araneus ventricosus]|uniref:Uncharacterized protein n=1 Tax=Araneus ventricosus TaxID=182803 RepID=A0A4Y2ENI8_ARAVE|nr:hypothetical protein AVEN_246459-1 [Araneus ventricosus]